MCKLFAIVDIQNEDNAIEFSDKAVKPLTLSDNDGLGLVMMGDNGLGVERWLKPSDFPNTNEVPPELVKYAALLPGGYNMEGNISQTGIYCLGIHSRKATSAKNLENVHPFIREEIALIHNGIISNHELFAKEVSTCDSEALLSLYLEHGVKDDLAKIQAVSDAVRGWFAFMVFNPVTQSLDIVKDSSTSLYFASVKNVGTVFCTSETIIKGCAGRMKLPVPDVFEFPGNCAIRWTKGRTTIQIYNLKEKASILWAGQSACAIEEEKRCAHGVLDGVYCGACFEAEWKKQQEQDLPLHMRGDTH